jgi:hypothetical protein
MRYENGYAYAKACCITGKSFLGKKTSELSGIHTLNEFDRFIFPENRNELPGKELLVDLEKRLTKRAIRQILSVIGSYEKPPQLLVLMLKGFEYDDKIDCFFYRELLESLSQLDNEDRITVFRLLADEINLRNCLMVLRLRVYYHKSDEQIQKYLMNLEYFDDCFQKQTSLAAEAKASLGFSLDTRQDWNGWRWEKFLNRENTSVHWMADPRYFQNLSSQYLYRLYFHYFHRLPMSVSSIYCFIKLKQFEDDILTSIAEGLSLGLDSAGVFSLLEME